jgi:hypothetical protein
MTMLNYLETATWGEIFEDIAGAVLLFAMIPLFPYFIAFMKAIFE